MMNRSTKKLAAQFFHQQQTLFGDIIRLREEAENNVIEDTMQEALPIAGDKSWFEQRVAEIGEEWTEATTLESLEQHICSCTKCALGDTRTNFVFGVGNPQADIVVIGEAPGAEEDKRGEPFVGAAGKLLTKILAAIHFERDDVYICNILKSRPPGNRTPEKSEVDQCIPYLWKQLDLIRPKFILAVGLTAAKSLLGTRERMKDLRGQVIDYHGISVIVTYHPAALLRNPQWKRATWEDVQLLRRLYDEAKEKA